MSSPAVVFRTDASPALGMGHLYRSLILARSFRKRGYKIIFVMKHVFETAMRMLDGFDVLCVPGGTSWAEEAEFLNSNFEAQKAIVVLDFSHSDTFGRIDGLKEYFDALGDIFEQRMVVDGFGSTCLAGHLAIGTDVLIVPYVGAEALLLRGDSRVYLGGAQYMVFDESYSDVMVREEVPEVATRILITMGGSDPLSMSFMALESCCLLSTDVEVRLVVGQGFSSKLVEIIKSRAASLEWCELVYSPPSLVEHMMWADIAISASGLTKYELALCGVPAVLISLNEEHAAINRIFDDAGTSTDMGCFSQITASDLAKVMQELLCDVETRKKHAAAGQKLVNMAGTEKIITAVESLL